MEIMAENESERLEEIESPEMEEKIPAEVTAEGPEDVEESIEVETAVLEQADEDNAALEDDSAISAKTPDASSEEAEPDAEVSADVEQETPKEIETEVPVSVTLMIFFF